MHDIFLNSDKNYMNEGDKHYFKTGCKFWNKPLEFGAFHHGIMRSYMKIFDDLNREKDNKVDIFDQFKKEVMFNNASSIESMRAAYNKQMEKLMSTQT